jgi:hypothetical protein
VAVGIRSLLYKVNRRLARFNDSFGKFALGSTAMHGSEAGGADAANVVGILGETDKEQEGQDADSEPPSRRA